MVELTKEKLLKTVQSLVVNELKRPDAAGFINPNQDRVEAVREVAVVLDEIFGLLPPFDGAMVLSSIDLADANRDLIERMRHGT
jgi:hypothetical protein